MANELEYREPTRDELRQALAVVLTLRPLVPPGRESLFITSEFLNEEGYPFTYTFKWNTRERRIEIEHDVARSRLPRLVDEG